MKMIELTENVWDDGSGSLTWADRSTAQYPQRFDDPKLVLLQCSIQDVFQHGMRGYTLDLDDANGGKYAIDDRISKATSHFRNNNPMDPPMVGYNPRTESVDFVDGRHRSVVAHQFGADYIPMFVSVDGLNEFKQLVHTR
jgi:hypothetical protein